MSSQHKGGKPTYTKRPQHNNNFEGESLPRDIEKKVRQVQEMFGDWKKNEIQRCLEENNYDVNLVVQKKVEGKEDWTTVEKKDIRTQKSTRGGRSGRGGRGGSRGGEHRASPSGPRSTSTSTQQPASSPTNDKPNKKKQSKQDKTTSSEVHNFSAPESEVVVEEPKPTQPQQAKVLSYSEAAAAFKKKEDEEKKKIDEEKKLLEQNAKDQKEQAKIERNQQRKKKGDKKAPKEEVKEPLVQEPVYVQPQPTVVHQESVVEEEVEPEEELVNEEPEEEVEVEEQVEEEEVEIQLPSQPIQQQQQPSQSNYQTSFERPTQQEEQPQLQMPSGVPYSTPQNIQFGTLDLGSQPLAKSQPTSQPNAQTNPQMQNGQFWNDPKMHHNYGIPYIPNQYPYHPQYYPYIYQYYQPQGAQGVNTNKNFNQGFGYSQEGFGMYNQATGSEDAEQHQQDANYPFMQQPYFFMYPQGQQMQTENKHKSESPQNEAKSSPTYPAYLPGYQSQGYPQSGYVFGHPNQIVYPAYPSGNPTNTTTHQQTQKKW